LNQSLPDDFLTNHPLQLERKWNVRMLGFASRTQRFSAWLSIRLGHSSVRITEKHYAPCPKESDQFRLVTRQARWQSNEIAVQHKRKKPIPRKVRPRNGSITTCVTCYCCSRATERLQGV
jgi:hypothetical protein